MSALGFRELARLLNDELDLRVMPFWRRHAQDRERGGLYTCLDEAGAVVLTEKYLWSQTRALWVFSTLAKRDGKAEDRQLADSLFRFCADYGRDADGHWVFRVTQEGAILQGADSIYSDGFALLGLAAYLPMAADSRCADLLRATAHSVQARLAEPGSYQIFPYHLPAGLKAHGVAMLFSLAFWEVGRALGETRWQETALSLAEDVLKNFVSESDRAVLEFIGLDNRPVPGPIGRCCLPGHVMESMWALIRIFRRAGRKAEVARCVEIIRWHVEKGWDLEFGGLYLAVDLDGGAPYWPFADFKLWWPAVESMYALLLAYQESGASWCLEWYQRVHNYAFAHYPVEGGEWRNRLDRRGRPYEQVVALPVKDPFHLPRALIYSGEVLAELAGEPVSLNLIGRPGVEIT